MTARPAPPPAPALALEDVAFRWRGRSPFALHVPCFAVARGETVLLLGESGSGKSTLLSLICGIVAPDRGRVVVDGTDLGALSGRGRDRFRAGRIGVIFQQFNLLPYLTPLDNVLLPARFARRGGGGDVRAEALALTGALGLDEGMVTRASAGTLSVGQQQRVAVARALLGSPPLIVADEPTSALDAGAQAAFLDRLFGQCARVGSTLLMVSHDPRLGDRFDRVVRLSDLAATGRAAA